MTKGTCADELDFPAGLTCSADSQCVPGGNCGAEEVTIDPVTPNLLIVLERRQVAWLRWASVPWIIVAALACGGADEARLSGAPTSPAGQGGACAIQTACLGSEPTTCDCDDAVWGPHTDFESCDPGYTLIAGACLKSSFFVDDYGALADGSSDATSAVRDAIAAAMQSGIAAEVVFSSGTYRLACTAADDGPCLLIDRASDLTLRGQGAAQSHLIISNPLMGFLWVNASRNITVKGLSLDYDPLPFTQGTIVQVYPSETAIDVSVEAGFPALDDPMFAPKYLSSTFGMLFDAADTFLKGSALNNYAVSSITKVSGGTFHLVLHSLADVAVGDRFALPHRAQTGLFFASVDDITLESFIMYSAPGAASIWVGNTSQIMINGFEVRRKPGTTRLLSTAADAIHMLDNKANLTIVGCTIEGMGDDPINTRSSDFPVVSVASPSSLQFDTRGVEGIAVGQTVEIVDPSSQLARGMAKVVSLQMQGDTASVSLDRPIAGVVSGDALFDADFASPYAVIRNNTFSNFRGMFRIRSPGAIFAENVIVDPRNANVLISADINPSWQEGPSLLSFLPQVYFNDNSVQNGSMAVLGANYQDLGAPTFSGSDAMLTHPLVYDEQFYAQMNPDLASMTSAELAFHWVANGIAEGRVAVARFKASEYLALYPDLLGAFGATGYESAIWHYLYDGAISEGRLGSIYGNALVFDSVQYRLYNTDLSAMDDVQLAVHWMSNGIDEGRRASLTFYSRDYLARYPDIETQLGADNFRGAIQHFVTVGYAAGLDGQ
ncbi:MAG: hypothetical protein JRI23_27965 [Deltaproteobacteria bacterium]|jgi:hypothetical protein|nr:hypothetical protein [Deltaproteobacteria bacterium]MBW2535928.1 hypothetical protein [Deltaproteobacteria bacterium]